MEAETEKAHGQIPVPNNDEADECVEHEKTEACLFRCRKQGGGVEMGNGTPSKRPIGCESDAIGLSRRAAMFLLVSNG